jgi:hypothetical protein
MTGIDMYPTQFQSPPPTPLPPLPYNQVRDAYRKRGWALLNLAEVEQCHNEDYMAEVAEQKGEGCHVWGSLLINKVCG